MPNTITTINAYAFASQRISSIVWSANLKKIGKSVFGGNNMETIDLPRSLEEIGEYAFSGNVCKEIKIRKNVKNIGYEAFCTGTDVVNVYCEATEKPENWNNSWVSGYIGFNVTINKYWNQTL